MRSMTGFGSGQAPLGKGSVAVEIRATNHRFLDLRVRASGAAGDLVVVAKLAERAPEIVLAQRKKLAERAERLHLTQDLGADGARLEQEIALFADRCDVAEELTRLESHCAQTQALLLTEEPIGR